MPREEMTPQAQDLAVRAVHADGTKTRLRALLICGPILAAKTSQLYDRCEYRRRFDE